MTKKTAVRGPIAFNHVSYSLTHGTHNMGNMAMYSSSGWPTEWVRTRGHIAITEGKIGLLSACHAHTGQLAAAGRDGVIAAGFLPAELTIKAMNDNSTQGRHSFELGCLSGMASLPTRDMIADGIEHGMLDLYDGGLHTHRCDKEFWGLANGSQRLDIPNLIISGGTTRPNCTPNGQRHIASVYDAVGAFNMGQMEEVEACAIVESSVLFPGGCGTMASFNSGGIVGEAGGLILLGSSSTPGDHPDKFAQFRGAGEILKNMFLKGLTPKGFFTKNHLKNMVATLAAIGGSTNAAIHLIALAREAGIPFTMKDLQKIWRKTPVMANFSPRGEGTMIDLFNLGGTKMLLAHLLRAGIIDGNIMTITGKTLGEELHGIPKIEDLFPNQTLLAPIDAPFQQYADIQVGFGNLGNMVFKLADGMNPVFKGTAKVFNSAEELVAAAKANLIVEGDVIILRYVGPAAIGMPELLVVSSTLKKLSGKVAFLTDGRMSGVSGRLFMGIHIAPEAWIGGPLAFVKNGDRIELDALRGTANVMISDTEMQQRKQSWKQPKRHRNFPKYLLQFCGTVSQSDQGCVSQLSFPKCAPKIIIP